MEWTYPNRQKRDDGQYRRVGFELEFASVGMDRLGNRIAELYGGELTKSSKFRYNITSGEFGDFGLEVDSIQLQERTYLAFLEKLGFTPDPDMLDRIDDTLFNLASIAVPLEIVTPPIPMDRIHELDRLETALREMHAKGTRASLLYGFGMQFNPEIPARDPFTLLSYLRAFLLLLDWLKQSINVNLTRRISPFINDFPPQYVAKVLDPAYTPGQTELIDDYMAYNPTRNRPLDMTCLFAHLDKKRTLDSIHEPQLVKPRPAFHYRLPDCRIDEPGWSMALEWNRWVTVECLAADLGVIDALSREYLKPGRTPARWVAFLKDAYLNA